MSRLLMVVVLSGALSCATSRGASAEPPQGAPTPAPQTGSVPPAADAQSDAGDVSREALAAFVRARKDVLQNCYERELKQNIALAGRVVVLFTIAKAGTATKVSVEEDTMGNAVVSNCLLGVVRGWVFPFRPEDDVPVAYPFVFSPAAK